MSYFDECKLEFTNVIAKKISDDDYFKINAISNSKLKLINPYEGGSPELYKTGIQFKYDPSMLLGSSIHECYLEPEEYQLSEYEGKPPAKLGVFIDYIYKYRKKGLILSEALALASEKADYYSGKLTKKILKNAIEKGLDYYLKLYKGEFDKTDKNIVVLPKNQRDTCIACLDSLKKNENISKLFKENIFEPKEILNEYAFFCDLKVTLPNNILITLPFKGKLDNVIIDHSERTIYLNDLKTTSKQIEWFMGSMYKDEWYDGSFEKLHYYRQLAVYLILLQQYCDIYKYLGSYNYKCNVILVETTGLNRSKLCQISQGFINEGLKEFKELICRVAYHEYYGYDVEFPELID